MFGSTGVARILLAGLNPTPFAAYKSESNLSNLSSLSSEPASREPMKAARRKADHAFLGEAELQIGTRQSWSLKKGSQKRSIVATPLCRRRVGPRFPDGQVSSQVRQSFNKVEPLKLAIKPVLARPSLVTWWKEAIFGWDTGRPQPES
jgi:hypothetical protein